VNSTYAYIDIDSATPVGPNDPGFTVTSNSCSFINVAATGYNEQCSITVQFTPSVVGPESANLQVVAWSNTGGASGTQDLALTRTGVPVPCPQGTKANFRWHYSAGGSAGGWSGTTTQTCPGTFSMGPQAMEGNPSATLRAARGRYEVVRATDTPIGQFCVCGPGREARQDSAPNEPSLRWSDKDNMAVPHCRQDGVERLAGVRFVEGLAFQAAEWVRCGERGPGCRRGVDLGDDRWGLRRGESHSGSGLAVNAPSGS
jgi:hypothetical protein